MNKEAILSDSIFWGRLARVTCVSMAASSDKDLRRQWIDDFIPESCKPSNAGLRVEGMAYVMGHTNGRFGEYRFSALLLRSLVRHPNSEFAINDIVLDHSRRELHLVVAAIVEKPDKGAAANDG